MLVNLKATASEENAQTVNILIQKRLPNFLQGPIELTCKYQVKLYDTYYLLNLKISGRLIIICQRCLGTFEYHYENESLLAACESELQAERLMNDYEVVTSNNNFIDLTEIVTDELYLYAPTIHANALDCDKDVEKFLNKIKFRIIFFLN